jgi:hypothetical protein
MLSGAEAAQSVEIATMPKHKTSRGTTARKSAKRAQRKTEGREAARVVSLPRATESEARLLQDHELDEIERQHPEGMTLSQIIETFARHGMHLSEATFRKYVQYGLLGRSRRVGRKGKHQGSLGLYPATTVRRVNAIKQMMGANYTIEDIQRSFLRFTDEIEALRRGIGKLLQGFTSELERGEFPAERRRALSRELQSVGKAADELVQRVESLERQLVSPLERAARERAFGSGAKGGAEELL